MNKEEIMKATMIGFYNKYRETKVSPIPPSFPPNISITRTIYFDDKGEVIKEPFMKKD